MLFPVLGEVNDVVDEQFHAFEAFENSQQDGLEPTRGRSKSLWHLCPFPQSILGAYCDKRDGILIDGALEEIH